MTDFQMPEAAHLSSTIRAPGSQRERNLAPSQSIQGLPSLRRSAASDSGSTGFDLFRLSMSRIDAFLVPTALSSAVPSSQLVLSLP
jgi:hypothetical protein